LFKGIILKQDVDQIWRNKKYSKFRKEKDYLLAVMTHLDILVEPKHADPRLIHQNIELYQRRVGISKKLSIQGRLMDE
jgi:hypothetical protein